MNARTLLLAALAVATLAAPAAAEDRTFLTPPLYRDQARVTATVRPASELTTVPSTTPRAAPARRVVAAAVESAGR